MHVDAALSEHLQGADGRCTAVEPQPGARHGALIAPPGALSGAAGPWKRADRGDSAVRGALTHGRQAPGRRSGADRRPIGAARAVRRAASGHLVGPRGRLAGSERLPGGAGSRPRRRWAGPRAPRHRHRVNPPAPGCRRTRRLTRTRQRRAAPAPSGRA